MNFHENWPAGSEDSMMIQHYRVLTVVMFCVHFFYKLESRQKNLPSSEVSH